jgi:hypothetical protein
VYSGEHALRNRSCWADEESWLITAVNSEDHYCHSTLG